MAIEAKDIAAITSSSIQEMVIYPTTDEQEVMTTRMTGTEETEIVDQENAEGGKFHFFIYETCMYITKEMNCPRYLKGAGLTRDLGQGQGTDTAAAVDLTVRLVVVVGQIVAIDTAVGGVDAVGLIAETGTAMIAPAGLAPKSLQFRHPLHLDME